MQVREKLSESQIRTLADELSMLTRLQYEALQRSSYLRMSQSEADLYDERRVRIAELCELLAKFRNTVS
jgi:hypothetical protein